MLDCNECEFYQPEILDVDGSILEPEDCTHPESYFHSCPKEVDQWMDEDWE